MLLLIFDVDHFIAVLALTDVAATVGLMKIDAVDGEGFVAVGALLGLALHFHPQLLFKLQTISIITLKSIPLLFTTPLLPSTKHLNILVSSAPTCC